MSTKIRIAPFLLALWQQFRRDKLVIRASGLAYASLLATVPLIAVLFALFSAFAAFDDLKQKVRELLFSQFLPTHQDEIVAYIDQATANVNRLGFLGFVFLIVTAILLLDAIEVSFNDIWHVRRRRNPINKVTAYTAVLVFSSVFLGASISVSARLRALLFTHALVEIDAFTRAASWVLPVLLAFVAFAVVYLLIPNTRVKLLSAAIGAIVAAILWELAKVGFANFIGQSVRYSTIYGSLATVPIFLIWLYTTWLIILLGLEIAFTHQRYSSLVHGLTPERHTTSYKVALALQVFVAVAESFEAHNDPPTCDDLSDRLEAPFELVEDQLEALLAADLVRQVAFASSSNGWVPSTSPDRVRLANVLRSAFQDVREQGEIADPLRCSVVSLVDAYQTAGAEAIGNKTARDVIEGIPQAAETESEEPPLPEVADEPHDA